MRRAFAALINVYSPPGYPDSLSGLTVAMQFKLKHLLVFIAIVGGFLSVILVIRSKLEPRLIVSVDHPNGTRLRVTQEFNFITDPFTTEIYFDDGDGQWRWYYYDHEDWYWGSADSRIDGSEIHITSNKRRIVIDTRTGRCSISNSQGKSWTRDKSTRISGLPPGIDDESTPSKRAR